MDGARFDRLVRRIGADQSRRGVLKALGGGVLGAAVAAVGLGEANAAQRLRANGVVCGKNADCGSGFCAPKDRYGRRLCEPDLCKINQVSCQALDQCHPAGMCDPATGICPTPVSPDGTDCDSGGGAGSGWCQAGVCVTRPISCTPDPDAYAGCPAGKYCDDTDFCVCHVGACASPSDCGYFDGCVDGCCCAEIGNQFVSCAQGKNNDCCSGYCGPDGRCAPQPTPCTAEPDFFGNCPGGQYCDIDGCVCHIDACADASQCGYFDGCHGGCCCAENGNQFVGCAPGHNNDCCSGYCDDSGRCAAPPPP